MSLNEYMLNIERGAVFISQPSVYLGLDAKSQVRLTDVFM